MKRTLALILALCMVFALAACGGGDATPTKAPDATGTPVTSEGFNVDACIASEPETLDPALIQSLDGSTYTLHMFESLMKYQNTDKNVTEDDSLVYTEVVPGQAESYTVSEDGMVYTFTLRDGIVWSDGQPVTAGDFVYAWQRLVDPATAASYGNLLNGVVKNATEINNGEAEPSTLGVAALDDKTFEVTLAAECPYFLSLCAFASLMPVRQDVVETYGASWTSAENIVVNGPYILSEWVHDSYIKMVPNEEYYNREALGPDSITWWLSDNQTAMLSAYQAGQYDFFNDPPTDQVESLAASGDLFINPFISMYYVHLSCEQIPDWRVRAAMALAIDREYLVKNVTQSGQVPATGLTPRGIVNSEGEDWPEFVGDVMYTQLAEMYPDYDLSDYTGRTELAQALYQEAVDDGSWDPATTVTYNFNTSESHKAVAESLQSDWSTVLGMSCTLANQDWNVYTNGLAEGNFGVARMAWTADYNDAITYLELSMTDNTFNYSKWDSQEYNDLVNQAKSLPAGAERDQVMMQAEKVLFSEGGFPISPVYFYTDDYCINGSVKDIGYTTLGYYFFMYATQAEPAE